MFENSKHFSKLVGFSALMQGSSAESNNNNQIESLSVITFDCVQEPVASDSEQMRLVPYSELQRREALEKERLEREAKEAEERLAEAESAANAAAKE